MNRSAPLFRRLLTLPNMLTSFRFVAAPGLLIFAWQGHERAFMILLAVAFATDMLDGLAARLTGQVSDFGAMLDSLADLSTYLTIAVCSYWLWPEWVLRELFYAGLIVGSCVVPPMVGMVKFGKLTSYHTWLVKSAAVCVGASLFLMFLGGPAWPFRVAALVSLSAAIEEVAITLLLADTRSNVRSLWDVLRRRQS